MLIKKGLKDDHSRNPHQQSILFFSIVCFVEIQYSYVPIFTSSDECSAPNTEESNKLKPGDFWEKFMREKKAGDFDVPSSQPKL